MVLHRRPMGESGQLLNVFSEQDGHVLLHAPRRGQRRLELNCLYEAGWQPDADWPRIVACHEVRRVVLDGDDLYCCSYLNELLVRLLPRGDAQPVLFHLYWQVLQALAEGQLPDPWLRIFEYRLLQALGVGFAWHLDADGAAIVMDRRYRFIPQRGFVAAADGWSGQWLLAMAAGRGDTLSWRMARQVLKLALETELGRPAASRELLVAPDGDPRQWLRSREMT